MITWQPSASLAALQKRARIIQSIREFFWQRNVLEVETPILSHGTVTDPHIASIPALFRTIGDDQERMMYLQTSPEYAMKRLLAAGSGPIFQITKSFRQGEVGSRHNPEFTMLEWYQPNFDHHALMDEVNELLKKVLNTEDAIRLSYAELFEEYVGINPHLVSDEILFHTLREHNIVFSSGVDDRNLALDLLMTHCIEPVMPKDRPIFVFDYPSSQAALAKIRELESNSVASRFEVYYKGIELGNGFHELQDAKEQGTRFANDLIEREKKHLPKVDVDERFLAALHAGLPDCSGIALGIDRLVMLALDADAIKDVISFDFERA